MLSRHAPIVADFPHLLHGADYNPEQWVRTPEVWDQDLRLMKEARCNVVSLGIFAWATLEPSEGQYDFEWMDRIMDGLAQAGIRVFLATPGGARPAWLALQYPEVCRVDDHRRRQLWGGRHNHCPTSPVYREKIAQLTRRLAQRYRDHPTLSLWHVNNEYSGECHCELCRAAFRHWLRDRYGNDLQTLNDAWWSRFWSHNLTDWEQINPPSPIGEQQLHGMNIDWRRFVTDQTIACFREEIAPLREITPGVALTTNFMTGYSDLDYARFARELDVVSWDSYPSYHMRKDDWKHAAYISMIHEQRRAMGGKPFLLMECAPGAQNYKPVCKLKRPGVHVLEGLQAIAHGSDSVCYFQWRKSRGGFEKFHGAVVDHDARQDHRVFREVAELGRIMQQLDGVVGAGTDAQVGLIYDYPNRWAIDQAAGPLNERKNYLETCADHHRPLWSAGVPVDVIDCDHDFDRYKLLIAPMLYMIRPGVAERLTRFVQAGGVLVTTYFTGIANESDLCFRSGFPGPLRELCGVRAQETDALYEDESVPVVPVPGNPLGLSKTYRGGAYCDILTLDRAQAIATYGGEFYEGTPAVTVNRVGEGAVYYVASRNDDAFTADLLDALVDRLGIGRTLGDVPLPEGVTAAARGDGESRYVFVLSFSLEAHTLDLPAGRFTHHLTGKPAEAGTALPAHGHLILREAPAT